MNPTQPITWQCEYRRDTSASPETIWRLFADVPGWTKWNAGIEQIAIDGAFVTGTEFQMKPPGQATLTSRLVDVRVNECFTDETQVGELLVRVEHRIQRIGENWTRVVYALEATGPGCSEVGPMIAADFPEVLKALTTLAEANHKAGG